MSLYCAICLYPAPCGRDHGEDRDGNPIKASIYARLPAHCEQPGCWAAIETWCPLCERCLCHAHDPVLEHDCLRQGELAV